MTPESPQSPLTVDETLEQIRAVAGLHYAAGLFAVAQPGSSTPARAAPISTSTPMIPPARVARSA